MYFFIVWNIFITKYYYITTRILAAALDKYSIKIDKIKMLVTIKNYTFTKKIIIIIFLKQIIYCT